MSPHAGDDAAYPELPYLGGEWVVVGRYPRSVIRPPLVSHGPAGEDFVFLFVVDSFRSSTIHAQMLLEEHIGRETIISSSCCALWTSTLNRHFDRETAESCSGMSGRRN
jgi:hypothetical protein